MTIKYSLFGKPGNFYEFVDKVKTEGLSPVVVMPGCYRGSNFFTNLNVYHVVILKAQEVDFVYSKLIDGPRRKYGKYKYQLSNIIKAEEAVERLKNSGIEATILDQYPKRF